MISYNEIQDPTEYNNYLYNFLAVVEGLRYDAYSDPKGIPSNGVGFNLRDEFVLSQVLIVFGVQPSKFAVGTVERQQEEYYVSLIRQAAAQTYNTGTQAERDAAVQRALDEVMELRAADPFLDSIANRRTTFDFTDADGNYSEELVRQAYDLVISEYEKRVNNWLGSANETIVNSFERTALVSLAYQGFINTGSSPALKAAILAGDRAEAWYEIRYNTNREPRRYRESDIFSLYNNKVHLEFGSQDSGNDADAKAAYRMFTRHGYTPFTLKFTNLDGTEGLNTYNGIVDYESKVPPTSGGASTGIQTQLELAQVYLVKYFVTELGIPLTDIAWNHIYVGEDNTVGVTNAYLHGENDTGPHALNGSDQSDLMFGESGSDTLNGGEGSDVLYGGKGLDRLNGGNGYDYYMYNTGDGIDLINDADNAGVIRWDNQELLNGHWLAGTQNGGVYQDASNQFKYVWFQNGRGTYDLQIQKLDADGNSDPASKIFVQNVAAPTPSGARGVSFLDFLGISAAYGDETQYTNTVQGDAVANSLSGTGANDQIFGLAGDDTVGGGAGDDYLEGNEGDDILKGDDSQSTALGNDVIYGGDGNDAIHGFGGVDYLDGGAGRDIIFGDNHSVAAISNDDTLLGGEDDDILVGDFGSDWLDGGSGNDLMIGEVGDDVLEGGDGNDHLYGDGALSVWLVGGDLEFNFNWSMWIDQQQAGGITTYTPMYQNVTVYTDLENVLDGGDVLNGGAGDDFIYGGLGLDLLDGGADNDLLVGGDGDDEIYGGIGNDILWGDAASFSVKSGNDALYGGAGDDQLLGEAGDDVLFGGDGNDILWGDGANDTGIDTLDGGLGDDVLYGGGGNDTLTGGDGVDTLAGEAGADTLNGGAGNDTLTGGDDDDTLSGGDGNDLQSGDAGNDVLYGNAGIDQLQGGIGNDILYGGADGDTLHGEDGDDTLFGEDGDDSLVGGSGNDVIDGGVGSDLLWGMEGNDVLIGGAGIDTLNGGDGHDLLDGGAGNNMLFGDSGNDVLTGGVDNDTLSGGDGNDTLSGGDGNDLQFGNAGNDVLYGNAGIDELQGGVGNDLLNGGEGDDKLYGDAGDDTLDGGAGNDVLWGDAGSDIYRFGRGYGSDRITNYDISTGKVDAIQFNSDVTLNDVSFNKINLDLVMSIKSTSDQLTIVNYFANAGASAYKLEEIRFSDGTVLNYTNVWDSLQPTVINGTELDDTLYGTSAPDAIYGFGGSDIIYGGASNDRLYGGDGDDYLNGQAGDDVIMGDAGNDSLFGGTGNDTLDGGMGNDVLRGGDYGTGIKTYVFGLNYGQDTIEPYVDSPTDFYIVQFKPDIAPSDITVSRAGSDLVLSVNGTTDMLTIKYALQNRQGASTQTLDYNIDFVVNFANGTNWNLQTLKPLLLATTAGDDTVDGFADADVIDGGAGNDLLFGHGGNDTLAGGDGADALYGDNGNDMLFGNIGNDNLTGGIGNDTIDGGAGNDTLSGNGGYDTYLFGRGDGSDLVSVRDDGHDTIRFKADVLPADIKVYRENDDLVLQIIGTTDTLRVVDNFADIITLPFERRGVEIMIGQISFSSDGTVWDLETILLKTRDATDQADWMSGSLDGSDNIDGLDGDDKIWGYGGNDALYGGVGNDVLWGHEGNDLLIGGAGNDRLLGDLYSSRDWSDWIMEEHALPGNDTLDGGTGDDQLWGGAGDDTYLFGVGYGHDTIVEFSGNDNILLESGISTDDVLLTENGFLVTLHVGDDWIAFWQGDSLFEYIEQIRFAGGAMWDGATIQSLIVRSTEDADTIYGSNRNDLLSGLGGNDILYGKDGNDTLNGGTSSDTLIGGAGDDWLNGDSGADILDGGAGNDILSGGSDDDAYLANLGYGHDRIVELSGEDRIEFGAGIELSSLLVSRVADDLVVECSQSDTITIENWFMGQRIESVLFADGSVATADHLEALVGGQPVNRSPVVSAALADITVQEDSSLNLTLPANTFSDADFGDTLTYSATLADGSALPSWLSFDAVTQTFSGTPGNADVGALHVLVTATDSGNLSASDTYVLTVNNVNDAPEVLTAVSQQSTNEDASFSFTIPVDTFTDIDVGDALAFTVSLADGSALPAWLSFDSATQTFTGIPGNGEVGTLSLRITATDTAGDSASSVFNVVVNNVNDAPTVSTPIADQAASEDAPFSFTLSPDTFTDVDLIHGDTLTYGTTLADGSALPAWLTFDAATRTFSGIPGNSDVGFLSIRVTATDSAGASSAAGFGLGVSNVNDAPQPMSVIPDQQVDEYASLSFALPANVFTDADLIHGDTLSYSATLADGSALPAWLAFDSSTQTFSGSPVHADVGSLAVRVTTSDQALATASVEFAITVQPVGNAIVGGDAGGWLGGTAGADTVVGGAGTDLISAGGGNDILDAGSGNDALLGGAGNDLLLGGAGNDALSGGAGADTLVGGAGNDVLTGGTGNDLYRFGYGDGQDQLLDVDTTAGNRDTVALGASALDIVFTRAGLGLALSLHGGSDTLSVQGWELGSTFQTEVFQAADGSTLANTQVDQLIQAMATFSANNGGISWDQAITQNPSEVQGVISAYWQPSA